MQGSVVCALPPAEAGRYNVSFEVRDPSRGTLDGFGQAARSRYAKQAAAAGAAAPAAPWHLNVVAAVAGLSAGGSGLAGGEALTVSGVGFSTAPGGNAVDLPARDANGTLLWVPCAVASATPTAIVCVPGAAPASTAPAGAPLSLAPGGGAGLLHSVWLGTGTGAGDPLRTGTPDFASATVPPARLFLDADATHDVFGDVEARTYYDELFVGYFVPPVTANYTFFVWGDDLATVFLSPDASPAGKALVAHNAPSLARKFSAPHASAPRLLAAGARYYFQAQHSNGAGPHYFMLGARVGVAGNAAAAAAFGAAAGGATCAAVPDVQRVATTSGAVVR